ncbi:MAG: hypothetical protein V3R27_05105 [Pseudomonadales bacterium]
MEFCSPSISETRSLNPISARSRQRSSSVKCLYPLLFLRKVGLATSQTSAEITEMLKVEKR